MLTAVAFKAAGWFCYKILVPITCQMMLARVQSQSYPGGNCCQLT